jgi:hypothetical protein
MQQSAETTQTVATIVYHHKRGRPRKVNVRRSAKGKSLGEDISLSVVFTQPHRIGTKDPNSSLLGYPLGRLVLANQISEIQHRAGNEWGLVVKSYAGIMGIPIGSVKSGSAHPEIASVGYSFGSLLPGTEEHDKRVASLRGRYDACFERLTLLGRALGRGRAILIALRQVCIEEHYPSLNELGDLRLGLNALAVELKIGD